MLDRRTVATTYVRAVLAAAETHGIDAERVLRGLMVDQASLAIATGRISVSVARQIWERAVTLTANPLLGLKAGQDTRPSNFGMLGLACMSCASLQQAIGVMLRYQRLVSESGMVAAQAQKNGDVALIHTEQAILPLLPQQVEAVIAGIYHQARWLAGRDFLPTTVQFRHAPLGSLESYQRCFGITPCFEADTSMIVFAMADLQAPLPYADADLCRMHCDAADHQLAALPQVGGIASFAVQWISSRVCGTVRVEDLADALSMSVRSLQRALKDEGQSWSVVVDEARREALVKLLRQGHSLAEAAQQLGYHDASSISRAARRWFGTSAGQWRSESEGKLKGPG